ncbi:hypothetical protein RB598_004008 [Gaeumannomyces tritici]
MASNEPQTTNLDSESETVGSTAYKLQLDQAARDANAKPKSPEAKPGDAHPIVETAVGKLLAGSKGEVKKPTPFPQEIPGPPERPAHDTQIEEFVRDQHRSKTDALLEDKVQ